MQSGFADTHFRSWKRDSPDYNRSLAHSDPRFRAVRESGALTAPGARRALAGLFVSGMLFSFLGAILPSWGHHLRADYEAVGSHFLSASIGLIASVRASAWLLQRKGIGFVLAIACAAAAGALLYLAAVSPPAPEWTRRIGALLIGASSGLLQAGIFHAIGPIFRHDPAATTNLGGVLFGLGSFTVALLISGTFYVYTVPSILILLAVVPGLFAVLYARIPYRPITGDLDRPIREVLVNFRTPTAILFALLLFFQFGNEWAIAGWLALFLVQRLGINPAKSLLMLATFWLALLVGRILMQALLPHVRHSILLLISMLAGMLGCLMLALTDKPSGALIGILLVGSGFASIYPLVVEKIGGQFPHYHAGIYSGLFTLALTGGMLAPTTLGFLASWAGVQVVMLLPLFGSVMVLLLLVAIWVESRFGRHGKRSELSPKGPS